VLAAVLAELIDHQHPILACTQDITTALLELTRAERQLAELKRRAMASAQDLAVEDGARDIAAWIAPRTRADWTTARTRRLASPAQRKALALRDEKCRAEGCTVPARWREAHHLRSWSAGGRTDLTDLVFGCNHHHHLMHDPPLQPRNPPQRRHPIPSPQLSTLGH
jgi:hypothetical protein